jgi:hypothetical protein
MEYPSQALFLPDVCALHQYSDRIGYHKNNHFSVSDYYFKMCHYADDLAVSGTPLRDDELVAYLLTGLDEEYNLVFTSVVARSDPIIMSASICRSIYV